MPAAVVDSGHRLQRSEPRPVVRRLDIAVDMVARRGHQGIVQVAGVVPYLVFLHDFHVAHLNRKEVLDDRLPHSPVVNVGSDAEDRGRTVPVAYAVEALLRDIGEIDFQVIVAQEIAFPRHSRDFLHEMLAVGIVADQRRAGKRRVPAVRLYDGDLALVRKITHLRGLHHRRIGPIGDHGGLDVPLHGALGRTGRDVGAQDEPAVVVVHAAVVQLERSVVLEGLDGQAAVRVVRTRGKHLAYGIGLGYDGIRRERAVALSDQMFDVRVGSVLGTKVAHALIDITLLRQQGGVGLLGIDSLLVVHDPGFAEKVAREEFDIESCAPEKLVRDRGVEIHRYEESPARRLQRHGVGHAVVGIYHGVETCVMAAGVRETKRGDDAVSIHLAAELFRDRLPLAGRGLEAYVAVAGDTAAVHQHGDAALMALGIEIVKGHDVHPVLVEVSGRVQAEVLGPEACRTKKGRGDRKRRD